MPKINKKTITQGIEHEVFNCEATHRVQMNRRKQWNKR